MANWGWADVSVKQNASVLYVILFVDSQGDDYTPPASVTRLSVKQREMHRTLRRTKTNVSSAFQSRLFIRIICLGVWVCTRIIRTHVHFPSSQQAKGREKWNVMRVRGVLALFWISKCRLPFEIICARTLSLPCAVPISIMWTHKGGDECCVAIDWTHFPKEIKKCFLVVSQFSFA